MKILLRCEKYKVPPFTHLRVAELLREELLLPLRLELLDELLLREVDTEELLAELLLRELDTELLFDELPLREVDTELLFEDVELLEVRFVLPVTRSFVALPLRLELVAALSLTEELLLRFELLAAPLLTEALSLERVGAELEAPTASLEEPVRRVEASEATTVRLFSSELTLTTRLSLSREGTLT